MVEDISLVTAICYIGFFYLPLLIYIGANNSHEKVMLVTENVHQLNLSGNTIELFPFGLLKQ